MTEPSYYPLSVVNIASWQHDHLKGKNKKEGECLEVGIPVLQRGLVWSPQQNELLWDSLMRGIPIGGFVVCKGALPQKRKSGTSHPHEVSEYSLLDGQQRANAISLGFDPAPFTREDKSILWIDVDPQMTDYDHTSRGFMIRMTTPAHPWGYQRNDARNRYFYLDTQEKHNALNEQNWKYSAKRTKPYASEMRPYLSRLPLPLPLLLQSYLDLKLPLTSETFWEDVKNNLIHDNAEDSTYGMLKKIRIGDSSIYDSLIDYIDKRDNSEQKSSIFEGIKRVFQSQAFAIAVPTSIMKNNSRGDFVARGKIQNEDVSTMEHLFTRLNSQGSMIEGEELVYSIIKSYFPEIIDMVDECAAHRTHGARMLRMILQLSFNGKIDSTYSLSKLYSPEEIRKKVLNERTETKANKQSADSFINEFLGFDQQVLTSIFDTIDKWMGYEKSSSDGENVNEPQKNWALPKVLRTSLIHDTPDLYVLFMFLARHADALDQQLKTDDRPLLLSFIMAVYWFDSRTNRSRKYSQAVNVIGEELKRLIKGNGTITLDTLKECLFECYRKGFIFIFPTFDKWAMPDHSKDFWNICFEDNSTLMRRFVWDSHELLFYALRGYINDTFSDYDPSRKDLWEGHNRPWDIDHIIPKAWKTPWDKDTCDSFMNSIANKALIPMSVNRSKSNNDDWEYYKEKKSGLLFNEGFLIDKKDKIGPGIRKPMFHRFCSIFEQIWGNSKFSPHNENNNQPDGLHISTILDFSNVKAVKNRRRLFTEVKDALFKKEKNAGYFYVIHEIEKPVATPDDANHPFWQQAWITVAIEIKDKYLIALSSNTKEIEIGIRKAPFHSHTEPGIQKEISSHELYSGSASQWWYYYDKNSSKKYSSEPESAQIAEILFTICNQLK